MKLIVDHLTYEYNKDTTLALKALDDVSLVIRQGEMIGLIGHTGSGKSTLVQHLNALLTPDSGTVYFDGEDVFEKDYDRKKLRGKVGLVFQYPEHQLFEETVFREVCFGPKNMGVSRKQSELSAYAALKQAGVPDECFYQSPFDLSGGQKRRVAIASVLAMKPEILILDEPTAGLDPRGRYEILTQIRKLKEENNVTVLLVSHSMEDVAEYVDRIVVMDHGKIRYDDTPRKVFAHFRELEAMGLAAPQVTYLMQELQERGFDVDADVTTIEEAKEVLLRKYSQSFRG